ncbi:MAG TPA: Gfo/Idh/MocA family oxidoreductase [Abditibacteriaceae bacterium]|jgi:predicted dehydrogenase
MSREALRTALVGANFMGAYHLRHAALLPEFAVVAICDLNEEVAQTLASEFEGAAAYSDYSTMLRESRPDVVIIATSTAAHAPLTLLAVESGVRAVHCEKPMAVNLGDACAMVEACSAKGVSLLVNHQRRTFPVYREMRRLMESGALGEIELIRASCAGDVLSDGTHLIDTVRHLNGDNEVKWVFGQVTRQLDKADESGNSGFRYGHPVETGSMAILQFENGVRAEIFTGSMQQKGRWYQEYEVIGTQGRLHRNGDSSDPPLLIQDAQAGGWRAVPVDGSDDLNKTSSDMETEIFGRFADMIFDGATHPMSGDSGFKNQEIVMAIYESARLRARVDLPLKQDRFPLELMIEAGEL